MGIALVLRSCVGGSMVAPDEYMERIGCTPGAQSRTDGSNIIYCIVLKHGVLEECWV